MRVTSMPPTMRYLFVTLFLLTALHGGTVSHGPIVHWNQDPAKSCEIVWLERSSEKGIEGKWSSGPANEVWEYLANAKPEDGWQTRLAASRPNTSSADFDLAWRTKNTDKWASCPVSSKPFANSAHRRFSPYPNTKLVREVV
jgi:hypothetical protein